MKKIISNPNFLICVSLLYILSSQILSALLFNNKYYTIDEVPIDKYLIIMVSTCFLVPVFEEIVFRGWFNFRFNKFITVVLFLLFLFHIYDWPFVFSNNYQFTIFEFVLSKFYVYIFPEGFLNYLPFNKFLGTTLYYSLFKLPFALILAKIILEIVKRLKIRTELESKVKKSLIFFSSVLFYLIHINTLSAGFAKKSNYMIFILFLIPCVLYPIFRLKYGLKQSIIFHSIFNLSLSILYFNEFNSTTFLYYLGCICVIGGLVWTLFKIKKEPVIL